MSNKDLKEKFSGISIWDIAEFWIETYPEDIFINNPPEVVEIRNQFKILLSYRKKRSEKHEN